MRLHGRPLGVVEVDLPPTGLAPAVLAEKIEATLAAAIDAHLEADGLARRPLGAGGIAGPERPACTAAIDDFLERAPFVSVVIPTRDRSGARCRSGRGRARLATTHRTATR